MAWDPTQPPNNGALLSAPIRANWAALAPLMQGPGGTPFPLLAPDGTGSAPSYSFAASPTTGLYQNAGNLIFMAAGVRMFGIGTGGTYIDYGFLTIRDLNLGINTGVRLLPDADHVLGLRNLANAQTLRVYETIDGGGNGSWLEFSAGSTMLIMTRQQGTGLARALGIGTMGSAPLMFRINNATVWLIDTNSSFYPGADNAYDIGGPSLRPRSIYAGTSFVTPVVDYPTGAAPATPAAGHVVTYAKADKKMYQKDDAGLETPLGGGGTAPSMVPLWLENARFPDGSANNLFPLPVERISTGTVVGTVPKLVELVYQFRAANVEWLLWKCVAPLDYVSGGAVVLVTKWTMISATTGNIRVTGAFGHVVDGTTQSATALVTPAANVSADQSVPTTLGAQKETRLTLTSTGLVAGSKLVLALSLGAGGTSPATGDRVLESAHLEFARA